MHKIILSTANHFYKRLVILSAVSQSQYGESNTFVMYQTLSHNQTQCFQNVYWTRYLLN